MATRMFELVAEITVSDKHDGVASYVRNLADISADYVRAYLLDAIAANEEANEEDPTHTDWTLHVVDLAEIP